MRLPPLRPALSAGLALLALPLSAAQYSSTSPQELQRRLEQDTNRLVDSLRNQRNSPGSSSGGLGKSPWQIELEGRAARREESNRLDAEWRQDHPNETRQQYRERLQSEAAEEARAAVRAERDRIAAEKARLEAERARYEREQWEAHRRARQGYAARTQPPMFATPAEAVAWFLAHDRAAANPWAANQAAMLLIDGCGVPADPATAAGLVDPQAPRATSTGGPHAETLILSAYLQLAHPAAVQGLGLPVDGTRARAELERLASGHPLAKWYLARLLADAPAPAGDIRVHSLLIQSFGWMRSDFENYLQATPRGRNLVIQHLDATATAILVKRTDQLPAALAHLSLADLNAFGQVLPAVAPSFRAGAVPLYVEAVATRAVPATIDHDFDYSSYEPAVLEAAALGADAPHGLATLGRLRLLGGVRPAWALYDRERALAAFARWSARDDLLGARTRLALAYLAAHSTEPIAWELSVFEDTDWKAAIRRRDAAAPGRDAGPGLLAVVEAGILWRQDVQQLIAFARAKPAEIPPAFAVTHATFDLAQAAAGFDSAFAPDAVAAIQLHRLAEATRLGDAFAPLALAREFRRWSPEAGLPEKLTQLGQARRARDEAARRPRALAARVIEARLNREDVTAPLAAAVAAGSPLALRFAFAQRLEPAITRDNAHPASWNVAPGLIAEFDATLAKLNALPDALAEWRALSQVLADSPSAIPWFQPILEWERDHAERNRDAALLQAVQPEVAAVLATLALWPGLDYDDPRNDAFRQQAVRDYRAAEALVETDGLGALKLFLYAAGRGDRGALKRLSQLIREGTAQLPRSAAFADQLLAASQKIAEADAEVGDSFAANFLGDDLLEGKYGPPDPVAGTAWLRYAAELGEHTSAGTLARLAGSESDHPADPAAARRFAAMYEVIGYQRFLPSPPRRLPPDAIDIAPLRAKLEAALTAATRQLGRPYQPLTPEQDETDSERRRAALELAKSDPFAGLTALAGIAATGDQYANFSLAQILARGSHGLRPDRPLARRFHQVALAQLQAQAEAGDATPAYHLGLQHLELLDQRDPATGIRWLSYAALRSHSEATTFLRKLYTSGAPGVPADPAAARRWLAREKRSGLPIPPLRPAAPTFDAAPLRPKFEAALAQVAGSAAQPAVDKEAFAARDEAASELADTDPAAALAALAELAGEGSSEAARGLAVLLSSGEFGPLGPRLAPDPTLAARFQTAARALQVADAERGDANAAYALGLHFVYPIDGAPDLPAGIRWLTYAAERGNSSAAKDLAQLYATGEPELPPDPAAAARWDAFAETITADDFKPRAPLR